MRIAVLTLTRDRLDYTKHCFAKLAENAGCDYDHYVVDQGSSDGTVDWLLEDETLDVTALAENVGICVALNHMLDEIVDAWDYDVIVRFDNDCEVVQPGTLEVVCEAAFEKKAILAPYVNGLLNPPKAIAKYDDVWQTEILGGIFMAIPAMLFTDFGFRYNHRNPLYTGDEAIVPWWRSRGGLCGYLEGWAVNHFETTVGQQVRFPEYHQRKLSEMAA